MERLRAGTLRGEHAVCFVCRTIQGPTATIFIASMDVVARVRERTALDISFVLIGVDSWRADQIPIFHSEHNLSS